MTTLWLVIVGGTAATGLLGWFVGGRGPRLRGIVLLVTVAKTGRYLVLGLIVLITYPDHNIRYLWLSLFYVVYYLGLSLFVTLQSREIK